MKKSNFLILILSAFCFLSCNDDAQISYNEVLDRITDLERLALLPEVGEQSGMFSSYDRRSTVDPNTGEYINWAANDDGLTPQYIRKEGENMVLAEMDGPGAIVRVWSASPSKGHIKIFVDGAELPIVDVPFIDYFKTSSLPVFDFPNLVYETSARGFNNYVPITFQKSIKIIGEPGWGQYYHFNYITFPEGTVVEPFETTPSENVSSKLKEVNDILGSQEVSCSNADNQSVKENKLHLNSGEKSTLLELEGKKAITKINVKFSNLPKDKIAEVYRKTILTIHWDDEKDPSVWSPIGDFFGSSPGHNEYKTLAAGMTKDAMYCNWYMPFAKEANISIENLSGIPVDIEMEVSYEKLKGSAKDYGRFHAKWHRDIMPLEKERWPDWMVVETKGRGRFVGMFLSVWNPKGGSCKEFGGEGHHWWGEGDEKFFVDGEKFPSTFGTGTEDYFGYAWCIPNLFENALHSQNYTDQNKGYQALNRWQTIDNIPFQSSFEATMEKYFPNEWPTQYATVAYWYLNEDGTDPIGATDESELFGFETQYEIFKEDAVEECELMKIVSNTGGWGTPDAYVHEKLYGKVSGHQMMIWFANPKGENKMVANFNSDKEGKYKAYANIITSRDGGVADLYINGDKKSSKLSFSSPEEYPDVKRVYLGTVVLEKGVNKLSFKAYHNKKGNRVALDYLQFEPLN